MRITGTRSITVGYARKANLGNYQTEDHTLELTLDLSEDATSDDMERTISDAQAIAKKHVLNRIPIRCLTSEEMDWLKQYDDPDDLPF